MAGSEISSLNLDDKYNLSASASVGSEALNLTSVIDLDVNNLYQYVLGKYDRVNGIHHYENLSGNETNGRTASTNKRAT